jgi:hypothetical protein
VKSDFYTSMVKGIIPDPYVANKVRSNMEINDDLKNSIKSIMFNDNYGKENFSRTSFK